MPCGKEYLERERERERETSTLPGIVCLSEGSMGGREEELERERERREEILFFKSPPAPPPLKQKVKTVAAEKIREIEVSDILIVESDDRFGWRGEGEERERRLGRLKLGTKIHTSSPSQLYVRSYFH